MLGYSIKKDSALRAMQRRAEIAEQRAAYLESDLFVCETKRDALREAFTNRGKNLCACRETLQSVSDELAHPMFNTQGLRARINEVLKNENV